MSNEAYWLHKANFLPDCGGKEYDNAYKTSIDPYYQHTITFSQNIKQGKKAKHWRMYGLGGCITDTAWIRALFITLTL